MIAAKEMDARLGALSKTLRCCNAPADKGNAAGTLAGVSRHSRRASMANAARDMR